MVYLSSQSTIFLVLTQAYLRIFPQMIIGQHPNSMSLHWKIAVVIKTRKLTSRLCQTLIDVIISIKALIKEFPNRACYL